MYDFRCTIWGVPALAREFGGARAKSDCRATYGRNEKAAEAGAPSSAYVRGTMLDVQHARRPQAAAGRLLIYDVRFINNVRVAQIFSDY